MKWFSHVFIACMVLFLLWMMPCQADARLEAGDIVYKGAFALPVDQGFGYGGLAMAYYPNGDPGGTDAYPGSLYVTGNAQNDLVAEVTIPAPVVTGSFQNLPEAAFIQPLTDITEGLIESFTECGYRDVRNVDGLAYLPEINKIVWNIRDWYNTEACDNDSLGWSSLNMTGAQGVWHIGPRPSAEDAYHNAKTCDYLFSAPQDFADQYLGGRRVIAGNHREGGALGGSSGPSLYAVRMPDSNAPPQGGQNLDALALVYYRFRFGCAWDEDSNMIPVPPEGACDFPGYRAYDYWGGGAWVTSGNDAAILIFGRKGVGENCYGTQEHCSNDPCNIYKGYHAYPYEPRILFYDPADIAGVASGAKNPWEVVPYNSFNPEDIMFDPTCGVLGAVAYDAQRGFIYAVEQEAGEGGNPAVHVWEVTGSSGGNGEPGDWKIVSGTVKFGTDPLCAMVLANGQYMFTCEAGSVGNYSLTVPLDQNGEITLFAFCDGLAPYRATLSPSQATNHHIAMTADMGSENMNVTYSTSPAQSGWWQIAGKVTNQAGTPLNVMVLANGQYMFTETGVGTFDLTVPGDPNGQITLFSFCDGLAPYKQVITP